MKEGDVLLSNHPSAGGTHLPDLTVITPVGNNNSVDDEDDDDDDDVDNHFIQFQGFSVFANWGNLTVAFILSF